MLALIRRDPLLGSPAAILRVLVALLLGTSVAEGVRTFAATATEGAMPGHFANRVYVAAALWLAPAILLLLSKTRERCRAMDLALPIEARRLWLAHTQTIWLLGLVLLAAGAGVLWGYEKIVFAIPGKIPVPDQNLELVVIPLAISLVLAVAALQSFRPGLQQVPADRSYRAVVLLMLGGGLGLGIALSKLPWFASLLPLVFAIGLTARTYHSLPPTFATSPREAESTSEPVRTAGTQEWETHAETGSGKSHSALYY